MNHRERFEKEMGYCPVANQGAKGDYIEWLESQLTEAQQKIERLKAQADLDVKMLGMYQMRLSEAVGLIASVKDDLQLCVPIFKEHEMDSTAEEVQVAVNELEQSIRLLTDSELNSED